MRRYPERLAQDPARLALHVAQRKMVERAAYWANRESRLVRQRAYVDANRAIVYARNADYYRRNKVKILARRHATYLRDVAANRAKDRKRGRERYARDPNAHNEYMKMWRAANPERARAYVRLAGHRRRAAAGGERIRVEDWECLLKKHKGRCAYCEEKPVLIEADHRTPLSRGGRNTIDNILPSCRRCNRRKRTKTEDESERGLQRRLVSRRGRRRAPESGARWRKQQVLTEQLCRRQF